MIRSIYFSSQGVMRTGLEVSEFAQALQDQEGLLWVDFESTPAEKDEPVMREIFKFHPLAIEDALLQSHVPKLDDWSDYLYIVLHAVIINPSESDHVDTLELDVFLGRNYIVTHHDQTITAVDRVLSLCQRDERYIKNGSSHLLYRLADEVVASYMPVIETLDIEVDKAEDQIFNDPDPVTLERIFRLKRAILHLRRIVGPQREVLNKLARDDYEVISSKEKVYFRDIYDHLVRLYDVTDSIRDLVSGALDIYLSVINNRMNDIMKTLTIITTMFMPISFLVGFFGMNFFMPARPLLAWVGRPAFVVVLLITILTPLGIFFWIRRRGWM